MKLNIQDKQRPIYQYMFYYRIVVHNNKTLNPKINTNWFNKLNVFVKV
jgi:hypothetical protein